MTAAAQELSVSPGAISRQVRQLEDHLGLALFDGTKARPVLTEAARRLQPVLTEAFQKIEDTVREITDAQQGPLDVSCFSTFTVKWLIPRLFNFHAEHPGIEIRLRTTDAGTQPAREGCDLLIIAEEAGVRRDDSIPLFAERLGPVLAPALIERRGMLREPSDLRGHTLLQTRMRRDAWSTWALSAGAELPTEVSAAGPVYEHYYFTLEAAVRGLGVAIAPWHLVASDIQAGRLVAPFGFTPSGYNYVALRRSAATHHRLDVFCQWLSEQAQAMPLPEAITT